MNLEIPTACFDGRGLLLPTSKNSLLCYHKSDFLLQKVKIIIAYSFTAMDKRYVDSKSTSGNFNRIIRGFSMEGSTVQSKHIFI